jgi:hypothetical protein
VVTFNQPQLLLTTGSGYSTYRLSWTSNQTINNGNPYRIYIDGVLVSTQVGATYDIRIGSNQNPMIEVLDTTTAIPSPAFPGYLELGWVLDANAAQYRIDQMNNNGQWVTQATMNADSTSAWQEYTTPVLTDQATAQWRIVPIDAAGNAGTPVAFMALMVRYPDVPTPLWTYNGSIAGTLTLAV